MIPNETESIKCRSITARVDFNFHETKRRMDRLKNIELMDLQETLVESLVETR